jgi:hypothetical protein
MFNGSEEAGNSLLSGNASALARLKPRRAASGPPFVTSLRVRQPPLWLIH